MRLLANENVAGTAIRTLRRRGHDVLSAKESMRGESDAAAAVYQADLAGLPHLGKHLLDELGAFRRGATATYSPAYFSLCISVSLRVWAVRSASNMTSA